MAHRSSPAALHTARLLMKLYDFEVKPNGPVPGLRADEHHLSVVIDYGTMVHEICNLRPELRYWQERLKTGTATAPGIATFLQKIVRVFQMLPQSATESRTTTTLEMPAGIRLRKPALHMISRPAEVAAATIFSYYAVTPKQPTFRDAALEQRQVAKLIDAGTKICRAIEFYPRIEECRALLNRGALTEDQIAGFFRRLGVVLDTIPHFEELLEESKLLA